MIIHKNWVINLTLSTAIIATCIVGDKKLHAANERQVIRAIFDNAAHGLIGLFACAIAFMDNWDKMYMAVICMIISSAIDLDHFIAAKSFRLSDATNLSSRPFLHNSLIPLIIIIALLICHFTSQNDYVIMILTVLTIAFSTHHIRDANRRGLLFAPFFQTPPIPYLVYIGLSVLIPFVCKIFIVTEFKYSRLNASQLIIDV